ncbi:MAG: DUF4358 domain-containing protein [Lachnospiraceae bacterium]|nr:DUF4358 domain-containing protein [Lachnospiraceae bacterium]
MKRIAALLLAGVMALGLFGCGEKSPTADAVSVGEALTQADTSLPEMTVVTSKDENAELNFTTLCDADYGLVSSYYYAYASDGTAPEVAIVTTKKEADNAKVMEAIVKHVETRRGTMAEYSPEEVELVTNYTLVRRGRVICYIVSKKRGLSETAFTEYMDGIEAADAK